MLAFIVFASACSSPTTHTPVEQNTTAPKADTTPLAHGLKVIVLPTTDGMLSQDEVKAFEYPGSFEVDSTKWRSKIDAFGVAYHVRLGIKGWTGKGAVGVDGTSLISLYPQSNDENNTPYISYYQVPACVGCILGQAAKYFKEAKKVYDIDYNDDGSNPIEIPKDISIKYLSTEIAIYSLPVHYGLSTKGVAIYKGTEDYHEATFVLPTDQSELADYLVNFYIEQMTGKVFH